MNVRYIAVENRSRNRHSAQKHIRKLDYRLKDRYKSSLVRGDLYRCSHMIANDWLHRARPTKFDLSYEVEPLFEDLADGLVFVR